LCCHVSRIADGGLEKNAVFTQIYEKEQREEKKKPRRKRKEEREMVYFH